MARKTIKFSLIALTLVGSPCFASGEPTLLYLSAARAAEKKNDHRKAIYCLCSVLIASMDHRKPAPTPNQEKLLKELKNQFVKASLHEKAAQIDRLNKNTLSSFLEEEMSAADPGISLKFYSDGSFLITRQKWDEPVPTRVQFGSCPSTFPSIISKGSLNYSHALKKYWWFKTPSQDVLSKCPVYTPHKIEPAKPDGAFKTKN